MELKQYLKMSQQLVMTPQLQQAIKLLQLSRVELEEQVQNELLENPLLEVDAEMQSPDDVRSDIENSRDEEAYQSTMESAEAADSGPSSEGGDGLEGSYTGEGGDGLVQTTTVPEGESVAKSDDFDWERFVEDYQEYSSNPAGSDIRLSDDEMPTLEQTLSSKATLADHLEWQLQLTQLTDEERGIGREIIFNLTPDGYVPEGLLPQISEALGVELSDVEMVLTEVIWELDPIGVGARDLKECLLLQAKHYFPKDTFVHDLISKHLENLEKKNVPPILKDLDCDLADLSAAMVMIRELEPKPGRGFASPGDESQYVTPDVFVVKLGDEYLVQLNEDGLPKLKISSFYQNAMKSGAMKGQKKEKEFIQDKFKSAVWLIRSIHQRQQTIRKVSESIVRFQREFLDKGNEFLRPLILRDVADDIGMHESTVSRVTTNKYMHTPQGIFELKYFFNSRIQSSEAGGDLASESVKQKIKKHIAAEDPKKPHSDQKLCEMLEAEGMNIARRTVAKYREMMNIAPSSARKKVF